MRLLITSLPCKGMKSGPGLPGQLIGQPANRKSILEPSNVTCGVWDASFAEGER